MIQFRWRWSVFIALVAIFVMLGFGLAWAQGWVPHMSGVALADDMLSFQVAVNARQSSVERSQKQIQLILINASLKVALKDRCVAISRNNQQALDAANTDIARFRDAFHDLSGYDYYVPDCSVILIADKPAP